MCWSSLGVASVFLLLFLLDIIFDLANIPFQPFGGMDYVVDVLGAVGSVLLIYLSWNALRDLR
ncbi:MAG: hypothetical protein JNM56_12165 [Planctomycetia bacterium]|nr:hypothetical protein [Planctomycetia bacterium]